MTGIIKKLNERGFGMIESNQHLKDIFFHSDELVGVSFDELREGDSISFEKIETSRGSTAISVQRAYYNSYGRL